MKQKYFELITENFRDEKKKFKNVKEIMYRERYARQKVILEAELKEASKKVKQKKQKPKK